MRPEEVYDLINRQPFHPLRVFLSTGEIYEIRHPRQAMVGETEALIGRLSLKHPPPVCDGYDLVSLKQIERIESLPLAAPL